MKIQKRLMFCLLPLALAGCADDNLTPGLSMLKGQKIEAAIPFLGYPKTQVTLEDKVVYRWWDSTVDTFGSPAGGLGYGSGFGGYGYGADIHSVTLRCDVSLITKDSVIVDAAHEGNAGGCRRYNDAFEALVKKKNS